MVGYLGYDIVRRLEKIGPGERDDLRLPELTMLLTSDLAVMDHWEGSVLLIANAINHNDLDTGVDEAHADAVARLDAMEADLSRPVAQPPAVLPPSELPEYTALWGGPDFQVAVEDIKERIRAGEAFQVVPSQRFETPCTASALDVYRVLRATNPSPYMYLFRFDGFDVVGSSPEALVKVEDGRAMVHPIAGTRPRGATPQEDQALADELMADPKERAEHLMLVDLGRNDLGRVCEPGSVEVVDFMSVERYSHVMHIVSTVTGKVAEGRTAFDVLTACFPAGTLSGAPKPRAMQIIDELEPSRRGCTAAASATWTSPATPTRPSPSAPPCSATARRTSRPARASSPTPTRSPRTRSAATRRRRSCGPCTRPTGWASRALLTPPRVTVRHGFRR